VTLPDEDLGQIRMQNLLFRMSETPGEVRHAGRRLGQDTDDVLREWIDISDTELAVLRRDGVTQLKEDVAAD